jgi:hypothetical protein
VALARKNACRHFSLKGVLDEGSPSTILPRSISATPGVCLRELDVVPEAMLLGQLHGSLGLFKRQLSVASK